MSSALAPTLPASSAEDDAGVRGEVSTTHSNSRKMRLKVSYSFDEGNKSNCLARWPHLVNTPVVQVDRDLQVGAIEFRTCILSIIAGSPELVARQGPDYSIYAYDYSEPDIPLVGCGMLSWAMLGSEGNSTRLMVTGRVNSSAFVFLGNDDIRETLEVKIRLQKVDTFTQEQFVNSVHAYQALSKTLPGDFDASTWSNFLNANPRVLTASIPAPPPPPSRPSPAVQGAPGAAEPSRAAPSLEWKESSVSSSEDVVEPPKKKQRIRAPRPRKKKVDAGPSVPTHAPAALPAAPIEESSQAPESILPPPPPPRQTAKRQPPAPRPSRSREPSSMPQPSRSRQSPIAVDAPGPPEISPSPQCSNTMASSPPTQPDVVENTCSMPSPAPTSPYLPSLPPPRPTDLSGRLETLFEEQELEQGQDQDQDQDQEQEQEQTQEATVPTTEVKEEPQSDFVPQSGGILLPPVPTRQKTVDSLLLPSDKTVLPVPSPEPSLHLPKKSKRPAVPAKKDAPFSSDAAVVPSSEIGEDVQMAARAMQIEKPKTVAKSRTAAHMKTRIEAQLLEALKRGEMPKYCKNCGAIETGVWRRVKPPPADGQEEEDKGDSKVKGPNRREKEKELLLCNACGLWFLSHKTMRPQVLWESNKEDKSKGSGSKKRKKSAPAPTPPASSLSAQTSEACTEPIVVAEDDTTPPQAAAPPPPLSPAKRTALTPAEDCPASKGGDDADWKLAIDEGRRVARSSPVLGSAASPIDLDAVVDGMPSPKRRLFPEARKSSPEKPVGHPMPKRGTGKENKSPEPDAGSSITVCPTTPTAKRAPPSSSFQQLRTPMRSASMAILESSPCRSTPRLTPRGVVPATPERRLLKSPLQRKSLSPVAGLLEKLLAADPSVLADIDIGALDAQLTFDLDDNFLNTDYTMPSSPLPSSPPTGFGVYDEQQDGVSAADWSDFLPSTPNGGNGINMDELLFDTEEGANGMTVDLSAFIEEHSTSGGIVPAQVE